MQGKVESGQPHGFEILAMVPAGIGMDAVASAAMRAGGTAIIDLEFAASSPHVLSEFLGLKDNPPGLRLTSECLPQATELLALAGEQPLTLVLAGTPDEQKQLRAALGDGPWRILCELLCVDNIEALACMADGLVLRGQEAGGWVGDDTSFILLQKAVARSDQPLYVQGGIGLHAAAACRAGGAAGVILDDALLLLAESGLPVAQQEMLQRLSGIECRAFGEGLGRPLRGFARPGEEALGQLEQMARDCEAHATDATSWMTQASVLCSWQGKGLLPVGQGIGLAGRYRERFGDVAALFRAVKRQSAQKIRSAADLAFLDEGGALALSHGTRYPLVQGPMTRVSDSAAFAAEVAAAGALPFLALALLKGPEVARLLDETAASVGGRPWGVGLLGFVSPELRAEQCAEVFKRKPSYALIAGGRPDQAEEFASQGIPAYLHAPSPNLLELYLEQGARRFVFEGRECGGHIGPLASFPLWEQMIDLLLCRVAKEEAKSVHLLFAGGIHDARSAAMVAAMAAPLAERGMKIGFLMGTAYLFTQEIVQSGAIVKGFQHAALACAQTVSLESGPGHVTRCAESPFTDDFATLRRQLLGEKRPVEKVRDALEDLNLGRLRVASKGRDRDAEGVLVDLDEKTQQEKGMFMIGQAATLRDKTLSIAQLHSDVCVCGQQLLQDGCEDASPLAQPQPASVAIVGIGVTLPGANSVEEYWQLILDQQSVIQEVPESRWDWRQYFDADPKVRDKVYSKWGGFVDQVPFDPMRFGIPPNSMKAIDPFQLLTLETAAKTLADAGYADGQFDREHASVILGASGGAGELGAQFALRAELPRFVENPSAEIWDRLPEWNEESFAGTLLNVAAGRVANRLDFGGVNFTVDAACGSSMAAVSLAINELESGRSSLVLAGGFDTTQSAYAFTAFAKTQALSASGRIRTFDQSADGIAISEGVVMVALKRLDDAQRDGDRIYGVIKGAAGSSDGRALGLTAPRSEGQQRALRRAYRHAGFSPSTLGLIEAHGTGTAVGDRTEAQSISEVLQGNAADARSVAVGSVKTLLGHTKAAAGVAGLVKVTLALHHRVLPGHAGVEKPIDTFADPQAPVYLLSQPRPWLKGAHPRRAGASAFGFGGTNFHAVLEEYPEHAAAGASRRWPAELFVWRAQDQAQLGSEIRELLSALEAGARPDAAKLAAALADRAQSSAQQSIALVVVASDVDALSAHLKTVVAHLDGDKRPLPRAVRLSLDVPAQAPALGFVFPGQGAQYVNMGRETGLYLSEIRQALELADRSLEQTCPGGLSRLILPPSAFDEAGENEQLAALTATQFAQPAIGTLALGYLRLAETLGLRAAACAGHSYGEYAALLGAGVLAPEDFLRLSAARGAAMAQAGAAGEAGGMAAVQGQRDQVEKLIADLERLCVANHNAPEQVVLSGPVDQLAIALERLQEDGLRATRLPVSGAFHTELVAPAKAPLSAAIHSTAFRSPRIPVYSNGTARRYPEDPQAIQEQLDAHLLGSVEFVSEIRQMHSDGIGVFVELGPRGICSNMIRQILPDTPAIALDGNGGGLRGLLLGLAELLCAGVAVDLRQLFSRRSVPALPLQEVLQKARPAALSEHTWLLSGGCARPAKDPVYRTGKQPALNLETAAQARAVAAPPAAESAVTRAPLPSADVPASLPSLPAESLSGDSMVAYQQTMRQFLTLQEQVMARFLGGNPSGMATLPASAQTLASAPAPAVQAVAAATAAETPAPVQEAPVVTNWNSLLLGVVAQRTGYPEDMLDADSDLEADLGVDSIKRVEIIGALRQAVPTAASEALEARMDELTKSRTLSAMLQVLDTLKPDAGPPEPAAGSVATPGVDARALLMQVVSERTGYPEDMLDADADLEADLGIDSIKRVEIIGALRQALPDAMSAELQQRTEQFTRCRTLSALIEALLTLSGSNAPAVAAAPAAEPSAPSAPAGEIDLAALLLRIVAKRTGYPQDMLDADADLEADLGIDSIKRVEIIGALRQAVTSAQSAVLEQSIEGLTKARSLSALGAQIETALSASSSEPAAASTKSDAGHKKEEAASQQDLTTALPRYLPQPQVQALPSKRVSLAGLAVVLGPKAGAAEAVTAALKRCGVPVVQVSGTNVCTITKAVDKAREAHGPVRYLLHLHGLDATAVDDVQEQRGQCESLLLSLLYAGQVTSDELSKISLLAASRLGGRFGREQVAPGSPVAGGLNGMLNCMRVEFPGIRARAVDFAEQDSAQIAACLVNELECDDGEPEAGYVGTQRWVTRTVAQALLKPEVESPLAAEDVVLITGGARGITAEIARSLAVPGLHLVLLGRTPPPAEEPAELRAHADANALRTHLLAGARARGERPRPVELDLQVSKIQADREIRRNLEQLRAAGAEVEYLACDVSDEVAFGALIDGLYERYGRITGVIHGAGVIKDRYLVDKTCDSFARVVGTKLDSAAVMARRLRPESLRFLAFFTSVAGRYGNAGQTDYAAANEALNRLAWQLQARWPKTRVLSINWGPWAGGMASEGVLRALRKRGMEPIPVAAGCRYFLAELADTTARQVELVVGQGPWGESRAKEETTPVVADMADERMIA